MRTCQPRSLFQCDEKQEGEQRAADDTDTALTALTPSSSGGAPCAETSLLVCIQGPRDAAIRGGCVWSPSVVSAQCQCHQRPGFAVPRGGTAKGMATWSSAPSSRRSLSQCGLLCWCTQSRDGRRIVQLDDWAAAKRPFAFPDHQCRRNLRHRECPEAPPAGCELVAFVT